MTPNDFSHQSDNYQRIEKAIQFIEENFKARPNLDQIAASVHLSRHHFDRLFKRWAGVSPIQFLQYLTLDYTKQKLAESRNLLDTSLYLCVCMTCLSPSRRCPPVNTKSRGPVWTFLTDSAIHHSVSACWQ